MFKVFKIHVNTFKRSWKNLWNINAMAAPDNLVIDGSILEGGGQILRNAAALACITGQSITINKIRAGRSKPGLRPQHLSGLQLVCDLCGGQLNGGHVESTEVSFKVLSRIQHGDYVADTKTAGSICLLLQAALPCLLYGKDQSRLILRGGTNAEFAPQIDYFSWVFAPMTKRMGINVDFKINRRGYFPKGGGEVEVQINNLEKLQAIHLTERGNVKSISGRAFVAGVLPIKIARTMAQASKKCLGEAYSDIPINIDIVKEENAIGNGTGLILMAETSSGCLLAGSSLGKKGVPAESVAQEAANDLLGNLEHGGCVDNYLQDQLIVLMALAEGKSSVLTGPLTLHTKTAIHVAEIMTKAKFTVEENLKSCLIHCDGAAYSNN